ncbi:MAG: hypothetical protein NZM42_10385 [Gemmatales bacterium]|nr:hypothetical protein [Gemmatales bacterium]MDW8223933.1 hypothetical protein [Gemmatales bacterium]
MAMYGFMCGEEAKPDRLPKRTMMTTADQDMEKLDARVVCPDGLELR